MTEIPLDIWYRIIVDDLECDRTVLLSLALVSRPISELALDILWRQQLSLRPFYAIINSCSLSRSPARLVLVEEGGVKDQWGEWLSEPTLTLREPLNHAVRRRVRSYLRRVRRLRVKPGCPWLSSMLSLLATCVKLHNPVLPNLQDLHLSYPIFTEMPSSDIYTLLPLLTPSLQKIDLSVPKVQPQAVTTFLSLLEKIGCGVEQIRYAGPECPEFFSALGSFTALRSLTVSHNDCASRSVTIMTAIQFVSSLTSLHSLALDLGAFIPHRDQSPILSVQFLVLEELRLDGTTQDLHGFLSGVKANTLRKVALAFHDHEPRSVPYKLCFENLYSAFPDTREVSLEFRSSQNITRLVYPHLSPLMKMPIEDFSLFQISDIVPHRLTEDDLCALVRAWPRLARFSLISWSFAYSADILITFSQLQYLAHLEIYLDLMPIITSPVDVSWCSSASQSSSCPLEQLNIDEALCIPVLPVDIDLLLTHLLELFPCLTSVSSGDDARVVQERLYEVRYLLGQWSRPD